MRLEQKYFVPFMIGIAVVTAIIIIISSFTFQNRQQKEFNENVVQSDSLNNMSLKLLGENNSVQIGNIEASEKIIIFWAGWSDKSESMMNELSIFRDQYSESVEVIAALVMDITESEPDASDYPGFTYVDGTRLYNHLKVPGIPSYIYLKDGELLHAHVGYQKGAGLDTLQFYRR